MKSLKIVGLALVLVMAWAAVSEARGGRVLRRVRHPFGGGACSNGACR